jgi:hypothetical protein
MKARATMLVAIALVAFGLSAGTAQAENTNPRRCTLGEYNQLSEGMTKHRIEKILDHPTTYRSGRTFIYCDIRSAKQFSIGVQYNRAGADGPRRARDLFIIAAE